MLYKLNYSKVVGIKVFLERRLMRLCVGKLEKIQKKYSFSYDKNYLRYKKVIPLGQEFPLTKTGFESKELFSFFQDRIPSKENPAYPDYCGQFGIDPEEKNIFILLATIGRKGPSSFVFEPIWNDSFSEKDLRAFRSDLVLSTRDFGASFGISQATIVRIENKKASGKEVLRLLEIFYDFPDVAAYYVEKYAASLHSRTKEKLLKKLMEKNFGLWADVLTIEEFSFSQKVGEILKKEAPWAEKMLKKSEIKKALSYAPTISRKDKEGVKGALFEIRFAYAIHKAKLTAEYEFNAGVGDSSVDFMIDEGSKNKPKWLIELTSLRDSASIKDNTFEDDNVFGYHSTTKPWDNKNSPEVLDIIKAQKAILSKVGILKDNIVTPCKFPEVKEHQTPSHCHIIIVDMRGFNAMISDWGDCCNILYGSEKLPEVYQRKFIHKGRKELVKGIFDPTHPDPRSKVLQKRIHAVGFLKEKKFIDSEINHDIKLYPNPNFFSSSNEESREYIRELWPLKINTE